MCECGCKMKQPDKNEENLRYYCPQCNAYKETKKRRAPT